jgi:hypothetical protein
MFNIPIKKLKGVEKGSFVVLNKELKGDTDFQYNIDLMYVINSDVLRNGELVRVVPVLFNMQDSGYQQVCVNMIRAKETYVFEKSSLMPYHDELINFSDEGSDPNLNSDVTVWRVKNMIEFVNTEYELDIKTCPSLLND